MNNSEYSKNTVAPTPPMGWNSYDYYNTMVNETQVRKNAEFIAKNLKQYGWEYIVIDIQWSDPDAGTQNDNYQYIPFSHFCIDEFSRQIPAPNRFPSCINQNKENIGFKPLADYIHSLGLKFGIHIMRGIPRFAAHNHLPIKTTIKTATGKLVTADQIANPYSISRWNPDMYGVDYLKPGAQDYYNSIFELYAQWTVDFVKVDDICNTNMYPQNPYSAEKEIEMIAKAIENSGRNMVLSLSPGPAVIDKAFHMEKFANMWRITDDFWDEWRFLKNMFERCEIWQKHTGNGNWPDCDMLPLGKLGEGFGHGIWNTRLSQDEQRTMITLWSIFRSPLMIGTDLPQADNFTLSLLTNKEVLSLVKSPYQASQLSRDDNHALWITKVSKNDVFIALFNLSDSDFSIQTVSDYLTSVCINTDIEVSIKALLKKEYVMRDVWKNKEISLKKESLEILPSHSPLLLHLSFLGNGQ